ncbi:hypothetical protein BHE74_00027479 [Ensete ventricosum]|nr:hypothetical protein BHE74_00027479 [Ensete ventricosum]
MHRRCSNCEVAARKKERCLGIIEGGTTTTTTNVLWPISELRMGMRTTTTIICWKCCSCLYRRLLGSVDLVKCAYFVTESVEGTTTGRQELRCQEKRQLCRRLLLLRTSEREIRRREGKWHTAVRQILAATARGRMRWDARSGWEGMGCRLIASLQGKVKTNSSSAKDCDICCSEVGFCHDCC